MTTEFSEQATILVIDDDPASLRFLRDYLQTVGFLTLTELNGVCGLRRALSQQPDVVLLDILMPDLDGYEICRRLKATAAGKDIPVLFMSALTETQEKVKGFEAGAVDYITKPFQCEEIYARIQTHLTLGRMQKSLQAQNARLQEEITQRECIEDVLQQRNRKLQLLNHVNRLFSSSLEFDQVLETVLKEVQGLLDVVSLSFWLLLPESEELLCIQARGSANENLLHWRLPVGEGITGWVAQSGESVVVSDTFKDERHFKQVDRHTLMSVRSMISLPVLAKGEVLGVLNLADSRPGHFTRSDLLFVEPIAAAAAGALQNARLYTRAQTEIAERRQAQQALARSEEFLNKLGKAVETTEVGITITGNDGAIVYVNPADAAMHGYRTEELLGRQSSLFAASEEAPRSHQGVDGRDVPSSWKRERINRRKDGSVFPARLISNTIRDKEGLNIGKVVVCEDITERKRFEERLFQQTTLLRSVAEAMTCLLVGTDFAAAIMQALELLGFATEADRVYLFENSGDPATDALMMTRRFEWVIDTADAQIARPEFSHLAYHPHFSRWEDRLRANTPIFGAVRDFPDAERPLLEAQRILSMIIVPILIDSAFWGFIGFDACAEERQWSEEEKSILLAMAGSIGGAIARQAAEAKLLTANRDLKQTLENLQLTQAQLIVSEKMAALGQLVAGIAHELNTPIGAIRSSIGDIDGILKETIHALPAFIQSLSAARRQDFWNLLQSALCRDLTISLKEERKLKRRLIRTLQARQIDAASRIAETLVNIGIYDAPDAYFDLLASDEGPQILEMVYRVSGLHESTQTILTAIERASKVIFALKTYSHYDHSGEMTSANLVEGLETVLTLYHNQLKHGVEVIRRYDELQPLRCYPDELNQVWTNLIHNALQAMKNKGTLRLDVTQREAQAFVSISDSGPGIAPEIREQIFQPFFTTKPAGEGSGLGLDIVKKIIDKHQGKIFVESEPGRTTFRIALPIIG